MQALVTVPQRPHSTRVADVPAPRPGGGAVLVRPLEVGVCGTDRAVWTASRSAGGEKARLVEACGARHVATSETALAAVGEDVGGFAGLRVPLDGFTEVFGYGGVTATLELEGRR